jgi:uncharacterized protein
MYNDFCHMELNTDDLGRAKKFYSTIFSWKMEDQETGPGQMYTMIQPGSGPGGGMMLKPMPEAPNMWMVYVQVENIDETLAKVTRTGGKVIMPRTPIGAMGHIGVIQDPSGAHLGIWTPAK